MWAVLTLLEVCALVEDLIEVMLPLLVERSCYDDVIVREPFSPNRCDFSVDAGFRY